MHAPPVTDAVPAIDIANLRFLVVEDQGFQRWMVDNTLAKLGAKHVFTAQDGLAALDLYKSLDPPIDIIVSDLNMPGMDGMEFIRHVGEVGVPVSLIVASGLERSLVSSVETMARAYGLNLLGAIEKPVTPKKLAAAIQRHGAVKARTDRKKLPRFGLPEILEALADDDIVPFFQPKVDLQTRAVKGAEAVARWLHGDHGVVEPSAFIPVLEETGHIDELMQVMLAKGALACAGWRRAGSDASLSVNVSIRSLNDMAVADHITEIVTGRGLSPRDVVLEVTESAAATNLGRVLENLSRLRMKGFGLSIDDYGTGYSSMQQLTRIAFTELKIDQSFVRQATTQESCLAMLESSLEMASKLKITAVAEGVETQADWDLLRELGCPLGQGYYFGRPMSEVDFLGWMRR